MPEGLGIEPEPPYMITLVRVSFGRPRARPWIGGLVLAVALSAGCAEDDFVHLPIRYETDTSRIGTALARELCEGDLREIDEYVHTLEAVFGVDREDKYTIYLYPGSEELPSCPNRGGCFFYTRDIVVTRWGRCEDEEVFRSGVAPVQAYRAFSVEAGSTYRFEVSGEGRLFLQICTDRPWESAPDLTFDIPYDIDPASDGTQLAEVVGVGEPKDWEMPFTGTIRVFVLGEHEGAQVAYGISLL